MHYNEAYARVKEGLLKASPEVSEAYQNRPFRYVLEALLLDPETPKNVYNDLLGWGSEQVEEYRHYFFCIPINMPRLKLYQFIKSAPQITDGDIMRYDLLKGVYEYGWAYIDTQYNRGNNISIQSRALHSLKKMFGNVDQLILQCMSNPNVTSMQTLIKLMKSAVELETTSRADEKQQLEFSFVKRIEEEGAKRKISSDEIMNLEFDELNRPKPAIESKVMQVELTEIYKDVKPKEDLEDLERKAEEHEEMKKQKAEEEKREEEASEK